MPSMMPSKNYKPQVVVLSFGSQEKNYNVEKTIKFIITMPRTMLSIFYVCQLSPLVLGAHRFQTVSIDELI